MASRSRSCALPIWSPCASLNAATSAPSKNPRPSTQAALNAKTPKVSSISAMPDFPRTALRNAGEGAERQRREAGEGSAALALPDKPSIAVLPFANLSGDPEQEYFADGMVEEI